MITPTSPRNSRARTATAVRVLVVVVAAALAGLLVVGAGLAILFEVQGFGVPAEAPRALHLAGYVATLVLSVAVPPALGWLLLGRRRARPARVWPMVVLALVIVAVLVAALVMGLALS